MKRFFLSLVLLVLPLATALPTSAQLPPAQAWASSVLRTVRANIRHAEPRPAGAEVQLALQVDAQGKVTRHFLHKASGSASWDRAVLEAVARTPALPPPPADAEKPFRLLLVVRSD